MGSGFPVPWIPDKAFKKLCWAKCSMFFPLRFLRFVPGRAVFTHRQLPDMKIRSGLVENTPAEHTGDCCDLLEVANCWPLWLVTPRAVRGCMTVWLHEIVRFK